jgi:hypothetical protein
MTVGRCAFQIFDSTAKTQMYKTNSIALVICDSTADI